MNLAEYVSAHVERGECKCGKCIDVGNKPDPAGLHNVDMIFYKTAMVGEAKIEEFQKFTDEWRGEFNQVNIWDGNEHGFMELGGWLGSQDLAIQYMALGVMLGVFELLSPLTMLGFTSDDPIAQKLAGSGFLTVATKPQYRKVPDASVQVPGP